MRKEWTEKYWTELDCCMMTLQWAEYWPRAHPGADAPPRPSFCRLLQSEVAVDEWRHQLATRLHSGLVFDEETVARAVAHWEELDVTDPDRTGVWPHNDAQRIMRVVRAAAREGEGVILHPRCWLAPPDAKPVPERAHL
jgi:hypothetical protein